MLPSGIVRPSAPRIGVAAICAGIEAVGVRIAHAHRNGAVGQPQLGLHVAEPGVRQLLRDLRRPSGPAVRPPPDRSSQVASGVAALQADDVDDAARCARARLRPLRRCSASVSGSSPKTFTSIGVGAALEVAEHVLQQLDELDLDAGRRLRQLVAQVVDDLVGGTSRSPRGLSRTRMSPLFCCVANSPSSDPVRRVNAATPACLCEHRLHLLQHAVGLFERAARPASGSR